MQVGRLALPIVCALTIGGATACSLLLDTQKVQCAVDGDCAARGGAFATARCVNAVCVSGAADATTDADLIDGGPLGCLGLRSAPQPTTARATVRLRLHDFIIQSQPVRNVTVRMCPNAGDPLCKDVKGTARPDDSGVATFDADLSNGAFAGYFAIDNDLRDGGTTDGGLADDEYIPSRIFYSNTAIAADIDDEWVLPTAGTLRSFTSLYQLEPQDPKLGTVFLFVQDCNAQPLPGLKVSVDQTTSSSRAFYFVDNTPVVTATATDSTGYVGFLNLPTGARVLTGEMADTKQRFGSITLFSFPGILTFATLGPELRK